MAKENERRKVKVTSYKGGLYDFDCTLKELGIWRENRLEEIPEEYRDTALIDNATEYSYGEKSHVVSVYYYRPETDDEYAARLEKQKADEAAEREREIKQLEALKKKYGA